MKVLTFGVYDYLHYGHLKLFERASKLGDYLIVALQKDEEIHKTKPEANMLYDLKKRMEFVGAIRFVDEVIPYTQVDQDIKTIDFDIFVLGGDQNHAGFQRAIAWAESNGKQVIRLERTKGISSSKIKKDKN
jgi:glycerol-3-phosphate cytidylyltransferase